MLNLYHHGTSACAAKVRLALEEKGLEWNSNYIDILKGEQFTPEYLSLNPKGVVPLLIHNINIIPESTVICEYLDETFSDNPIYPRSPIERANVRLWTKIVDEELHPACSAITYTVSHRHTIIRNGTGNFDDFVNSGSAEGKSARALKWQWITQGLDAPGAADKIQLYDSILSKMDESLMVNKWLVGDSFSMADIALTPYLNRLSALAMNGIWENGRLKNVEQWFNRIKQRSSFKTAIVDWTPDELAAEMLENGKKSWPKIKSILEI